MVKVALGPLLVSLLGSVLLLIPRTLHASTLPQDPKGRHLGCMNEATKNIKCLLKWHLFALRLPKRILWITGILIIQDGQICLDGEVCVLVKLEFMK